MQPESFGDTVRLQDAVTRILRKYVDVFYRTKRERWESEHMVYKTLDQSDPNLSPNRVREGKGQYVISVRRSESCLMGKIKKLIADGERLYQKETTELGRIHFDRHLYQPLLVEHSDDNIRTAPPALNTGERRFVQDLKDYWLEEKDGRLSGREVFLLRNLSRGAGVSFFETSGFYPDFILWIKEGKKQHIVFVEPHGMIYANAYQHDEKAQLHKRLPELARAIGNEDVTLDSYLISVTSYETLKKKYEDGSWNRAQFARAHILFAERNGQYDYMKRIFEEQLT